VAPAEPIVGTLPGSIDVTLTGADRRIIQGTVNVAHFGTFQHTAIPYGEDPANGYFVAASSSDGTTERGSARGPRDLGPSLTPVGRKPRDRLPGVGCHPYGKRFPQPLV